MGNVFHNRIRLTRSFIFLITGFQMAVQLPLMVTYLGEFCDEMIVTGSKCSCGVMHVYSYETVGKILHVYEALETLVSNFCVASFQ